MEPLTVPGKLDSLKAIANYVMAAAAAAGLSKKASYNLRLAVDEIATNIIIHGYEAEGLEREIDIRANISEEALTLTIEDSAAFYDPTQQAPPDSLTRPAEEREIGGLGVYLATRGVDRFLYERAGNRNRNIFIVHLTTS